MISKAAYCFDDLPCYKYTYLLRCCIITLMIGIANLIRCFIVP